MKKIAFVLLFALKAYLCFCQNKITVSGITENRKGGAVVISNETRLAYFIGNVSHWEHEVVGKTVKVTGELHEVTNQAEK